MFKKILYNLNLIKKEHYFSPFIFIDNNGNPTNEMTSVIKWIDKDIVIKCKKKDIDSVLKRKAENFYQNKYKVTINWY